MPLFSKADPYRHQIILSLRSQAVVVMHYVRTLRGWRCAHTGQVSLADPLGQGDALRDQLRPLLQPWGLPNATPARWVLPPDVLGVLTQSAAPDAAQRLPFDASDVHQAVLTRKDWAGSTLLWLHKDWLQLLDGLCRALGLVLVEVFARAQLHQRAAPSSKHPLWSLVERDGAACWLHVYSQAGQILRSSQLVAGDAAAMAGRVQAELLSLVSVLAITQRPAVHLVCHGALLSTARDQPLWTESSAAEPVPEHALLEGTLDAVDDGIVVHPAENRWMRQIRQTSLGLGALGLAGLALMSWHDGQLEARLEADQKWLKKQSARYESLRVLQKNALLSAQAVAGAGQLSQGGALTPVMAGFFNQLPAHVVMTGFELQQGRWRVTGTGATSAELLEGLGKAQGFSGARALALAPGVEGKAFALELHSAPTEAKAPKGTP